MLTVLGRGPLLALATALSGQLLLGVQTGQQQSRTFRASVDLVTVDVVVTDANDRPVTDLTADDFELLQDGEPQDIAAFHALNVPLADRQVASAQHDAPVDVVANEPPPPASRQFVVVIDDLHLIETDIVPVRQILEDVLGAMTPADQVAVTFVGRSDLGVDFTSDVARLRQSPERLREAFGFGLDARPHYLEIEGLSHARSTAWVLRNVVKSLAGSPYGRRAVILISDGVNFDTNAGVHSQERQQAAIAFEEIRSVHLAAERAGVPIYTIDPRGVATPELAVRGDPSGPDAAQTFIPIRSGSRRAGGEVVEIDRRIRIQQDYLAEMAINTGGRHFTNRSNLREAVDELILENSRYYLLGYYPARYETDGEWHDIEVRVKRPGLRVRARAGFVPSGTTTVGPAEALDYALGPGVAHTGLPLRAAATTVSVDGNASRILLTLSLSYPDEVPRPSVDGLTLGGLVLGPDGEVRDSWRRTVTVPVGPPGSVVAQEVEVPPGSAVLRVAAVSHTLGRVGSVHMPLGDEDVRSGERRLGRLAIGQGTGGAGRDDLLPVTPTTERTFDRAERISVFARLFGVRSGGISGSTASVTLRRADQEMGRTAARLTPVATVADAADCIGAIDLAAFEPGDYMLTLSVTLPDGNVLTRATTIRVQE